MTVLTKAPQGGDFLIHMESNQYCLISVPVENPNLSGAAANVAQVAGTPVQIDDTADPTKATLLAKASITNANGFLIEGPAIKDQAENTVSAEKYSVLWAGPAVINQNKYNLVEPFGGAAYTEAECNTQADAMPNVKRTTEPAKITEQTPSTGDGS